MRKSLWVMLVVLFMAVCVPCAHADSISTFDVSGTATAVAGQSCGSSCAFSGTLTIDVTSGTLNAVDITFPGLASFTRLFFSSGFLTSDWTIYAINTGEDALTLDFTTTNTPGSLVGFTGGSIFDGLVEEYAAGDDLYLDPTGSITAPTATPEPSSVALMLFGVGLMFVVRKRLGQGLPEAR